MTKLVFVGTRVSDLSNTWLVSGNNIYSNYSGNVGIGKSNPTSKLDVSGTISASTVSATTLTGTLSTASQPNITSVGTLSSLNVSGNSIHTGTSELTGNVGIGKSSSATYSVDVSGNINMSGDLYKNGVLFTGGGGGGGSSQWTTSGSNIYYQTGNVGIGSGLSNPQYTLDVSGTVRSKVLFADTIQTGSTIIIDTIDVSSIIQYGDNTLVIDPILDRVGLGTSTPSATLDVQGTANITGNTTIGGVLYVDEMAIAGETVLDLSGTDDFVQIGTNNAMFIDTSNSRVGVGKSNPSCALDVSGTIFATDIRFGSSNLTVDTTEINTSITFGTNNTLHINPISDCVGIGTTTPTTALQVNAPAASWYPSYDIASSAMSIYGNSGSNPISTTGSSGAALNSTLSIVGTSDYARNRGSSLAFCGRAFNYSGSFIQMPFARITGVQQAARDDYGGDLVFEVNGSNQYSFHEVMRISSAKCVGIGTTAPGYPLEIVGPATSQSSGVGIRYFNYTTALTQSTGGITSGTGFSIVTSGTIWSKDGIAASSDSRIKTEITDLVDGECLNIINAIQPKTYKYIDKVKKADKTVYGFIAQQIKEVIPHAVSLQKDFIPNVFCLANCANGELTIIDPSGEKDLTVLLTEGAKMKLYDSNDDEHIVKVSQVLSSTTVSFTSETTLTDAQYFIYGKEVSDFHSLNKDYIFTINVCATQELSRKVTSLETQVAQLTDENTLLKQKIEQICAHLGLTL
jgi:hypothetical protein